MIRQRSSKATAAPPDEDGDQDFVPESREEADRLVLTLSLGKASAVLQAEALKDDFEGWHGLADEVARDYAGRFVAELIQNAHDAHATDRTDGEIEVVFDPHEGPSGTLYIANRGRPFTYRDLRSISVLAKSTKHPGQGIGNKGVGFKSVFLVSDAPEVYSAAANQRAGTIDGFCFTFASSRDYRALAGDDPAAAGRLESRRHKSGLPVPITTEATETVMALAGRGHNVVVRLPIKADSGGDVHRQLTELHEGGAPMLLFLERIRRLRLETIGEEPIVLEREVKRLPVAEPLLVERVSLGAQGTYLRASIDVPQRRFRKALEDSVREGKIDERWLTWSDVARVSVAVRTDETGRDDRLYCFLPMGLDAHSPFQGHLNGPFSVAIARKALVEDTTLNSLIKDVAAELCCRTAVAIAGKPWGRVAAADLVAWKPDDVPRLLDAARRERVSLDTMPLMPVLPGKSLAALKSAWVWSGDGMTVLTPAMLAAAGLPILDPNLGEERIGRIREFAKASINRTMRPAALNIAAWAEKVANVLVAAESSRRNLNAERWLDLYDDLAALWREHADLPVRLAGKDVVVTDQLKLLPCRGSSTGKRARGDLSVFFRPGSGVDDEGDDAGELELPPLLDARLAFPHRSLKWRDTRVPGRVNRPGRDLLEKAGVRQWRLEDLYPVVGSIVDTSEDDRVWSDALRFTFAAFRLNTRSKRPDVTAANLKVPTAAGDWIPAREARFGKGWPEETLGPGLAEFAVAAGDHVESALLRSRLLVPFDGRRFRGGDCPQWITFLEAAGVAKGLAPDNLVPKTLQLARWRYRSNHLLDELGLSADVDRAWGAEIDKAPQPTRRSPWTLKGPVYRIPGQGAYQELSADARRRFADLVLDGLASWPAGLYATEIESVRWPSPALTFLRSAAWLSVGHPNGTNERFAAPDESWHYVDDDGGMPAYAELLTRSTRVRIGRNELLWERLRELGVKEWGDQAVAGARLGVLTELAASTDLTDNQRQFLRRAYEKSWAHLLDRKLPLPWTEAPPLLVTVKCRLGVFDARHQRGRLYVLTWRDPLAEGLIDDRAVARLRVDPAQAVAVAALLRPLLPDRIVEVGQKSIRVSVDGRPVVPSPDDPILVTSQRAWLADLLAVVLNLVLHAEVTPQSTARAVARLRRIRLRVGRPVKVTVRNSGLEDVGDGVECVPVDDERYPAIVLSGPKDSLDRGLRWPQLEMMAPAIAELVGYRSADVALRFAVSKLAGGSAGPVIAPDPEDYASALGVRTDSVRDILTANRDLLNRLVFVVRPVIACLGRPRDAKALESSGDEQVSERQIRDVLERLPMPPGMTPDSILKEAREAESPLDLRDRLKIPFGAFNIALETLGGAYEADRHPEVHAAAFAAWLGEEQDAVLRTLRAAAIPSFDAGAIPAWYPRAVAELDRACRLGETDDKGEIARLEPDAAWLDDMPAPTTAAMKMRLGAWLAALGIEAAPGRVPALRKLAETRTANATAAEQLSRRAAAVVAAWCEATGVAAPAWVTGGSRALGLVLQRAGALDFRRLSQADVLAWATSIPGCWPARMRQSVDPDELGLSRDAVLKAALQLAGTESARGKPRRTVRLDTQDVSLDPDAVRDLISRVDTGLAGGRLDAPLEVSELGPMPPQRDRNRGSGKGGGRAADSGLSQAEQEIIGFIGELVAYRWLCHHLGDARVSWLSGMAAHFDSSLPGNDGLGYDIAAVDPGILQNGGPGPRQLLIEVKAVGRPERERPVSFSLTRGEVLTAQEHADDGTYLILLVVDALNSATRRIHLLPNPFSAQGKKVFRDMTDTRTMLFNLTSGSEKASG